MIGILSVVCLILFYKVWSLKKAVGNVTSAVSYKVNASTNTLIGSSCRDKNILDLVRVLNKELDEISRLRHTYENGDQNLKNALTNISHDLKTPICAIQGYSELLEKSLTHKKEKEYAKIIGQRAVYMNTLCEELFEYTSLHSFKDPIELSKVSLKKVLEKNLAANYMLLKEKNIEPRLIFESQDVIVMAQEAYLERIFMNLTANCAKYSSKDLWIHVYKNGEVLFSNAAKNMTAAQAGRLFERYYSLDHPRSNNGIGLNIVKSLMEKINGKIQAEYENGILTFRLSFQICKNTNLK